MTWTPLTVDVDPARPAAAICTIHGHQLLTCPSCNQVCEISDLPRWMCPCCPDFTAVQTGAKAKQPTAPDQPTRTAGYWSLRTDGRGDWRRTWHATTTSTAAGEDETTRTPIIHCGPAHLDDNQTGLCHPCTQTLATLLLDVPTLRAHLQIAVVGDARFADHGTYIGKVGEDQVALAWSERAAAADRRLCAAYQAIAAAVGVEPDQLLNTTTTGDDNTTTVVGLERFAHREDAPRLARILSTTVAAAHRAIDRPADLAYYGPCPKCGDDIYAERATDPDTIISCSIDGCGETITIRRHHQRILDRAKDRRFTVAELLRLISIAGIHTTRGQIDGWIRHNRLTASTVPGQPQWDPAEGRLVRAEESGYRLDHALTLAQQAQDRKNGKQ